MSSIINFLGSLRTGKGHLVSYGSYRMFKATVVNTLTLTRQIAESPADQILLEQLSTTIQRTNPDGAKYADCFDLDDLINRRIELYDKQPYSAMSRDVSAHRALARQCAVINLKLYIDARLPTDFSRDLFLIDARLPTDFSRDFSREKFQTEMDPVFVAWSD